MLWVQVLLPAPHKNMKKLIVTLLLIPTLANANELMCLARNIYFEARGESEPGQFLVGFVTMNRVSDKRFPNTICGVVNQPNQFVWDHSRKPVEGKIFNRIIYIASIVMQSHDTKQYGVYFNTTHSKAKSTVVAGNHRFYN